MKKFTHLHIPETWKHYWTKYPEGYTILESLIDWVSKTNRMVNNLNELNNIMDEFIQTFDSKLQETVDKTLTDWKESGFLEDLFTNVLLPKLSKQVNTLAFHIDNFGAKTNENYDSTTNIQQAIDFVASLGGGNVIVGNGTYSFSSDIHIRKKVRLMGAGKGSTLTATANTMSRLILHEESSICNLNVHYPHEYNDTAILLANRYLIPLDNATTPASGTENVRALIDNVYIRKPSHYGNSKAIGMELYSEGKVEKEVYSGYWGVNVFNSFIDGFHTAIYMHADFYGWVNGCAFDLLTVDKCKHFLITEKREGSLGIDYNHFTNCMVQTRQNTSDLIIEDGSRTFFDEFTVWDARVNNVKIGNAEFMRNPINFDSVPVTRIGTYLDEGYHYIGRFIGGRVSNVNHVELALTTSLNRRVNLHIRHDQVVEVRDYQGDFPYTDIEVLCKETPNNGLDVYIRSKKEYYFSIYAVSMRNFALSNRDKYDSVTGLTPMTYVEPTQIRTRYAKALFTEQTVESGGRLLFSSDTEDFTVQDGFISSSTVKRIRIVCNLAFTTAGLTLPNRVTATLMVNDQIASTGGATSLVLDDNGNTFMNLTSSILIGAETNKYWIRLTNAQGQPLSFVQDPRGYIEVSEVL